MATVTIHEAKTNLSELIRRVEAGEEIVIARGDKPVAILKDYKGAGIAARRKAGMNSLADKFPMPPDDVFFGPMSDEEFIEMFGQEFFDLYKDLDKGKT
jgi:prevent-host-death family protein